MNDPNQNPNSSPMHLGMTGASNPFTADELQELMGLIPGDQQQQQQHTQPPPLSLDASLQQQQQQQQQHSIPLPTVARSNKEIDDSTKNQARSERKRSREKQRRTDVNKQFGELTEVLKRIESEEQQWLQQQQLQQQNGESTSATTTATATVTSTAPLTLPPFSPTNRVDLIARTIAHLERLSHVTKKQVQEIANLGKRLKSSSKAGEEMAQKLKDAVFQQQQQGGMMAMNGMMGNGMVNPWNPMQMSNGMMSIQPQKQQMMMMVPMMMPGAGGNGAAPMMPSQPFMMMPQAFCPSQQPATPAAPATVSPTSPATAAPNQPKPVAPAPQLQNQQAMMMQQQQQQQQQAMMMQSMQPMMMQMMQQQQQQQQPQMAATARQQPMVFTTPMAQPMMAGMAPQPIVPAQVQAPMAQQAQTTQQATVQRLAPAPPNTSMVASTQHGDAAKGHGQQPSSQQQSQQGAGGGSYAYAA
eukprot:CAMPEP_0116136024 /NCGR_PEP_ID=MMETSP0329-20121206/11501_1 /TAXON_ID=697910 /ORGANISM="Pseudo-nitzschia arenysensis, Strain B593" /LENGTH=469 /DNA_ID=CAMNT_0003630859 /DNA_START=437 /DNA_END=1846 /DNA_ORIENTATION=+